MADQEPAAPSGLTNWIVPDAARMEALAEFAAGAGHEINNPLATIIGRAQLLLKDERDPQRRQMLQAIGAQAYRIRDMIGDTMLFGRPPEPVLQSVNLQQVVQQVIAQQSDVLTRSGCAVQQSIPSEVTLHADPAQLAIVISELVRNSRQAMADGGTICIRAHAIEGRACVEVEDHSRGFTETERVHAFDPFFSGRQAGRGLGFGLPKCWQILRQHGGSIEIESTEDGPTITRCYWPLP